MGYIANSAFTAGGVKYRPGENVPAIENAQKYLALGFIISDGTVEESEAPKSENGEDSGENSSKNAQDNGADNAEKAAENGVNKAKKAARK